MRFLMPTHKAGLSHFTDMTLRFRLITLVLTLFRIIPKLLAIIPENVPPLECVSMMRPPFSMPTSRRYSGKVGMTALSFVPIMINWGNSSPWALTLYCRAPVTGGYGCHIHIWMLRKEWLGLYGGQKGWTLISSIFSILLWTIIWKFTGIISVNPHC